MAMLRTDFEADEKQVRDERDFELKAVSQDKGSELDRERLELARVDLFELSEAHAAEPGEQGRHRPLELGPSQRLARATTRKTFDD